MEIQLAERVVLLVVGLSHFRVVALGVAPPDDVAINQQMDAGQTPRPMGMILFGFFARLVLTLVVLYG